MKEITKTFVIVNFKLKKNPVGPFEKKPSVSQSVSRSAVEHNAYMHIDPSYNNVSTYRWAQRKHTYSGRRSCFKQKNSIFLSMS